MNKINQIILYISLFLIYTQGLWERLLSTSIKGIVETFIIIFILTGYNKLIKPSNGFAIFLLLVLATLVTSIYHNSFVLSFMHIRYVIYFYLIYRIQWHTIYTSRQFTRLFKYILFLIIIQGFGAIFQIFVLNDRVEGYVGLMSVLNGATATVFPLFIISIAIIIYLFWRKPLFRTDILIFSIIICALLVSYSSGKRAIYFYLPLFLLISIVFANFISVEKKNIIIKTLKLGLIVILFSPIYFYGISTSAGLNYGLSGNESKIQLTKNAIEYALFYEQSENEFGSSGRTGTNIIIFEKVANDLNLLIWGAGPLSTKDDAKKFQLGVAYGFVGFTYDLTSLGIAVSLLTVFLILVIIIKRTHNTIETNLSRVIRSTIIIIFLLVHFTYSQDFTIHLKISLLLIILICFLNSSNYHTIRNKYLTKYFYN